MHIIGKDILRFHAIYWPAFLIAAKLPLPKRIFGHGWILSDDKKMSKSIGNILDPIDIINNYGIDQLRYYLIKVSLGNDRVYQWKILKTVLTTILQIIMGIYVKGFFLLLKKIVIINSMKDNLNENDIKLSNIKDNLPYLINLINNQNLNEYIKTVVKFSFEANKYFNDSEPWVFKKKDPKRMYAIIFTIVEQIKNISILLNPIIPISTRKVLDTINISDKNISINSIKKDNILNCNTELKSLEILFKKLKMIIDSHCHLTYEPMSNSLHETINRANKDGIKYMLISTEDKSYDKIIKIVTEHKSVYGTYGIHPHEAKSHPDIKSNDIIIKLNKHKKIIGIGETGLDFYYNHSEKRDHHFEEHIFAAQKKIFHL